MKYISILLIALCSSVYASDIKIKRVFKDKKRFVFLKSDNLSSGDKLYLYDDDKLKIIARIVKCKKKFCLGKVVRRKKKTVLSKQLIVSTSKKFKKRITRLKSKTKAKNKKIRKSKAKNKFLKNNTVLGFFGGPVSQGFRVGQRYAFNEKTRLGFMYGVIDTVLGNTKVSGTSMGIDIQYDLYRFKNLIFSGIVEYGQFASKIDFSDIDSDGPTIDESVTYYTIALDGRYLFTKNISFSSSIGFAGNGFADDYKNSDGDSYTANFAGGMLSAQSSFNFYF